jgi:ABC-type sugar transport system substrate-binding protein
MGQESARAMVAHLEGKTPEKEVLVPIKIVTSKNIEQELPVIKETVFANEM